MHFLRRQGAEAIDDESAHSAVKLPRPHLPASLIFEQVHIKAAADTATNLPVLTDQSDLSATAQNYKNTVVEVAGGVLPPWPCQRPCDVDDIIAASGRCGHGDCGRSWQGRSAACPWWPDRCCPRSKRWKRLAACSDLALGLFQSNRGQLDSHAARSSDIGSIDGLRHARRKEPEYLRCGQ